MPPVKLGVVVPCYRQERFLPRTVAAIERALAAHEWRGALVLAAPASEPLPALSPRWTVISPPVTRPLTPGAARMLGFAACAGDWVLFLPQTGLEVDVNGEGFLLLRERDVQAIAPATDRKEPASGQYL